jgi:phage terminase large subunit
MSLNFDIARTRVKAFNASIAAGSPIVDVKIARKAWPEPPHPFKFYGGAKELWESVEPRVMISGPAETGKTTAVLKLLDHFAWAYPGMQAAIVRKTYTNMPSTVLQSYEKKILRLSQGASRNAHGVIKLGGEYPQAYVYPNDSKIWIGGLDKSGKVLSSERDVIIVNQAEELEQEDWEVLSTRTTGRAGTMRPARLIGDCNPGPSTHWIMSLTAEGTLRLIKSRHEDNPTLFNQETGEITEQGIISLTALDSLTGVRYKRLRLGLWVAAEGVVYETFDAAIHIVDAPYSPIVRHVAGVDWGFSNPGVIQVWGVDSDKRMYRVEEVYRTQKLVAASKPEDAWWINEAKRLEAKYNIEEFACDPSEPAYIEAFQKEGLPAKKAFNSISLGIQTVESRLKVQEDGRPRLMLLRGSRGEPDPLLVEKKQISCLEEELEVYAWPKNAAGKPVKEVPVDDHNHACDGMRYAAASVDELGPNNRFFFGS